MTSEERDKKYKFVIRTMKRYQGASNIFLCTEFADNGFHIQSVGTIENLKRLNRIISKYLKEETA